MLVKQNDLWNLSIHTNLLREFLFYFWINFRTAQKFNEILVQEIVIILTIDIN
jgi:hypothetical protein